MHQRKREPLSTSTDGAVMILAVFMAMIAIGFLYYFVGLGDALLARERMQDAADASAFSSAVIHARGMNLLALTNIIMASVLAILVLLAMLASLFHTGASILLAASFFVPAMASGVPPLKKAATVAKRAEEKAKPAVETVLRSMHRLQGPMRTAIPIIASINAAKLASESYQPVVEAGTTFPMLSGLPTVEGDFDDLCRKAGEFAGLIAVAPIDVVTRVLPVGRKLLRDRLSAAAKTLALTYARFYCAAEEKPSPPSFDVKVAIPVLQTPAGQTCEASALNESEQVSACSDYQDEIEGVKAAYDFDAGVCRSRKAEIQELCLDRIRRARRECAPRAARGAGLRDYIWRETLTTRRFVLVGEGQSSRVRELEPTVVGKRRTAKRAEAIPCRSEANPMETQTRWNEDDPTRPVCGSALPTPSPSEFRRLGTRRIERNSIEVTDIIGCSRHTKIKGELEGEPIADEMKDMTPQEMCSCAAQGEEMFQVRSLVFGDATEYTGDADEGILVATQGRNPGTVEAPRLGDLAGRLAAAQAEFYFDDKRGRAEWLWHMKWKARMRRLRMSSPAWECPVQSNCPAAASSSSMASDFKRLMGGVGDDLIVH